MAGGGGGLHAVYVPEALIHYRIRSDVRGVLRQQFSSGQSRSSMGASAHPRSCCALVGPGYAVNSGSSAGSRGGEDARRGSPG